jgi:hypothetical protein
MALIQKIMHTRIIVFIILKIVVKGRERVLRVPFLQIEPPQQVVIGKNLKGHFKMKTREEELLV